jgi:hypothetical protein
MEEFVTFQTFSLVIGIILTLLGVLWSYFERRFRTITNFSTEITEIKTDIKWIRERISKL